MPMLLQSAASASVVQPIKSFASPPDPLPIKKGKKMNIKRREYLYPAAAQRARPQRRSDKLSEWKYPPCHSQQLIDSFLLYLHRYTSNEGIHRSLQQSDAARKEASCTPQSTGHCRWRWASPTHAPRPFSGWIHGEFECEGSARASAAWCGGVAQGRQHQTFHPPPQTLMVCMLTITHINSFARGSGDGLWTLQTSSIPDVFPSALDLLMEKAHACLSDGMMPSSVLQPEENTPLWRSPRVEDIAANHSRSLQSIVAEPPSTSRSDPTCASNELEFLHGMLHPHEEGTLQQQHQPYQPPQVQKQSSSDPLDFLHDILAAEVKEENTDKLGGSSAKYTPRVTLPRRTAALGKAPTEEVELQPTMPPSPVFFVEDVQVDIQVQMFEVEKQPTTPAQAPSPGIMLPTTPSVELVEVETTVRPTTPNVAGDPTPLTPLLMDLLRPTTLPPDEEYEAEGPQTHSQRRQLGEVPHETPTVAVEYPFLGDDVGEEYPPEEEGWRFVPTVVVDFWCDRCGAAYEDKASLETHVRLRHQGEFVCETCGRACSDRNNLRKHQLLHSKETRRFSCDHCGRTFPFEKDLVNHFCVHREASEVCPDCGKTFKRRYDLISHMKCHQEDAESFACPKCEKIYKEPRLFHKHVKRCAAGKNYGCLACGKTWKDQRSFRAHKCGQPLQETVGTQDPDVANHWRRRTKNSFLKHKGTTFIQNHWNTEKFFKDVACDLDVHLFLFFAFWLLRLNTLDFNKKQ